MFCAGGARTDDTFAPRRTGKDAEPVTIQNTGEIQVLPQHLPGSFDLAGTVDEIEIGTKLETAHAGLLERGGPALHAKLLQRIGPEFNALEAVAPQPRQPLLGCGVAETPAKTDLDGSGNHGAYHVTGVLVNASCKPGRVLASWGRIMSDDFDLREALQAWPYDSDNPVRMVTMADGRQVMQVRTPMGIEQYELDGRPDGLRPHDAESAFAFHQARFERAQAQEKAGNFGLTGPQCAELFEESVLYYFRYLHLFQLRDWRRVMRDTNRNLALFDFVHEHARREADRLHLEQWRPYILRMNAVARSMVEWESGHHAAALHVVRDVITAIQGLPEIESEAFQYERTRSLEALDELAKQIEKTQPMSEIESLERELHKAVEAEQFERAATLRDRLQELRAKEA